MGGQLRSMRRGVVANGKDRTWISQSYSFDAIMYINQQSNNPTAQETNAHRSIIVPDSHGLTHTHLFTFMKILSSIPLHTRHLRFEGFPLF